MILRCSARVAGNLNEEGSRTWVDFEIGVSPSLPDWFLVRQIDDFAFISRENFLFISKHNSLLVSLVRCNKSWNACFLAKYHQS